MALKKESIKKFVLIGLSLFLIKSVLILYAYLLDQYTYNAFNQSYYTASLLILFGSMGFNIAQTRIPINIFKLLVYVLFNIIIAYFVLHIISAPFDNTIEIISVILYSLIISVTGVLNFKLLFEGNYVRYFLILLSLTVVHLLIIPAIQLFNLSVFFTLSLLVVIWFIIVLKYFDLSFKSNTNVYEYYKIGVSAFIINSAVSIGLAGDKFIANHFFDIDLANTYTFAWSLTAPVFYIGTLIEKYLFAEKNPDKKKILVNGTVISFLLIIAYFVFINSVLWLFPSLLPGAVSKPLFFNLSIFMMAGYSIYVIFHFPLNTYLFKMLETGKQKIISIYFAIIITVFAGVFYYLTNFNLTIDYKLLLTVVWIYIFILLITKAIIIFSRYPKDKNDSDNIISQEFQDLP